VNFVLSENTQQCVFSSLMDTFHCFIIIELSSARVCACVSVYASTHARTYVRTYT